MIDFLEREIKPTVMNFEELKSDLVKVNFKNFI